MKVAFFATLRQITGTKETYDFSVENVKKLLHRLSEHYGERLRKEIWMDSEGEILSKNILILVNGRAIEHLQGLETPLQPQDEVAIFPKIAGG